MKNQWTTTPPTKPGYYWNKSQDGRFIDIGFFDGTEVRLTRGAVWSLKSLPKDSWIGPLPQPTTQGGR